MLDENILHQHVSRLGDLLSNFQGDVDKALNHHSGGVDAAGLVVGASPAFAGSASLDDGTAPTSLEVNGAGFLVHHPQWLKESTFGLHY